MGSPLLEANFIKLMDKNVSEVVNDTSKYMELDSIINKLYRQFPSNRAYEEFYSVSAVADIPAFNGRLTTLGRYPGYSTKIEPGEFAAQMITDRKLIDDGLYSLMSDNGKALQESAWRTADKKAIKPFTNATSTAFDFQTSEEGVSLASSSHTTKVPGVVTTTGFSNSGSSPMSKTAVQATWLLMRKFRQSNGERYDTGSTYSLVHPDGLADTAYEITKTSKGLDDAHGNANPLHNRHKSISLMRWDDTSSTSWAMVDEKRMKQDLIWIWLTKPENNRKVDFSTFQVLESIYARFGYGFRDWRWMYHHSV